MSEELEKIEPTKTSIKVKGKERELRFSFSAWAEIERMYGGVANFTRIEKDVQEKPFQTLPKLAYIGLVDKTGVEEEHCLDDYSMAEIEEVAQIIFNTLAGSLPQDKKKLKKVKAQVK